MGKVKGGREASSTGPVRGGPVAPAAGHSHQASSDDGARPGSPDGPILARLLAGGYRSLR